MQSHASKLSPDDKESELYQFQESFSDDSEIKEKQDVTEQFRNILRERQETLHQKKIMTYLYLTSTFLVIIVFVIKITMMNNYDKMQDMEATLQVISAKLEENNTENNTEDNSALYKEAVSAEEEPAESTESAETTSENEPSSNEEIAATNEEQNQIEETAATDTNYYVVQEGDTLASICRKIYGNCDSISEVCELNQITDENKILYGQKILLT